ncbi:hypothetical protein CSA37_05585 [Candidatus Fermentibacteria bacterium]|nr:MAG: hypothetical protein CSA37_05585 [Candidatus Fermentibacteria bacterium]
MSLEFQWTWKRKIETGFDVEYISSDSGVLPLREFEAGTGIISGLPDRDRMLYERFYCAGVKMENRIKEQQLNLSADRTGTHWISPNQLRLRFSPFTCILLNACRTLGMKGLHLFRGSVQIDSLETDVGWNCHQVQCKEKHYQFSHRVSPIEFCLIHRNICSIPLRI